MAGHKIGNYFFYAIGEILLVMIGILLALQVNNWNEARKSTQQEIKILRELNNDLKTNYKEVEESHTTTTNRYNSTILILNYFDQNKPVDDDLKKAFELIRSDGIFNISNTSYKFIENQGINVMSNDNLRIRITEMYERHLKNIRTREDRNWDLVNEELIPHMINHFKSSPTVDPDASFAGENLNMPRDITSLRNNDTFRNIIIRLQDILIMRLNWQGEAKRSLGQLITDVNDEIVRLDK